MGLKYGRRMQHLSGASEADCSFCCHSLGVPFTKILMQACCPIMASAISIFKVWTCFPRDTMDPGTLQTTIRNWKWLQSSLICIECTTPAVCLAVSGWSSTDIFECDQCWWHEFTQYADVQGIETDHVQNLNLTCLMIEHPNHMREMICISSLLQYSSTILTKRDRTQICSQKTYQSPQ